MDIKRLPSVSVARPCSVTWDSMHGIATRRECSQCNRSVHNLSALTAADAEDVLNRRDERVCIMFSRGPDGDVVTVDRPARFALRPFVHASAVALAAAMAFAVPAGTEASSLSFVGGHQQSAPKPAAKRPRGGLRGTIRIQNIADLVPDALITAKELTTGEEFYTRTDAKGAYLLPLSKGRYKVEITSPGFGECTVARVSIGSRVLTADANISIRPIGEYEAYDGCGNPKLKRLR